MIRARFVCCMHPSTQHGDVLASLDYCNVTAKMTDMGNGERQCLCEYMIRSSINVQVDMSDSDVVGRRKQDRMSCVKPSRDHHSNSSSSCVQSVSER